jgi:hypothetical protein
MKSNVVLGEWELPPGTPVLGRISPIPVSSAAATAPADKGLAWRGSPERKSFSRLRLGSAWMHSLWVGLLAGLLLTGYYKGWELF